MHRFACVVLVDTRGWLLLQERDEHAAIDPERWGMVGGHVEEGEDFEPAAYRELEEETGLRLPAGSISLWREIRVFHEVYGTADATQVWIGRVDLTDADIVVGEGRQIVFVDPEVALLLELTTSATIVVPELLDSDEYRTLTEG